MLGIREILVWIRIQIHFWIRLLYSVTLRMQKRLYFSVLKFKFSHNTFLRKGKDPELDPEPYSDLWLMDPDPDPQHWFLRQLCVVLRHKQCFTWNAEPDPREPIRRGSKNCRNSPSFFAEFGSRIQIQIQIQGLKTSKIGDKKILIFYETFWRFPNRTS